MDRTFHSHAVSRFLGRTRKESSTPDAANFRIIEINDPVAGFRYVLDEQQQVVHRSVLPASGH